jgi:hypothetical protein
MQVASTENAAIAWLLQSPLRDSNRRPLLTMEDSRCRKGTEEQRRLWRFPAPMPFVCQTHPSFEEPWVSPKNLEPFPKTYPQVVRPRGGGPGQSVVPSPLGQSAARFIAEREWELRPPAEVCRS